MGEGEFSILHGAIVVLIAVGTFGMPFLAGYFIGRYVELKKSRKPEL